jgi:uncharacterized protein YcaQ
MSVTLSLPEAPTRHCVTRIQYETRRHRLPRTSASSLEGFIAFQIDSVNVLVRAHYVRRSNRRPVWAAAIPSSRAAT